MRAMTAVLAPLAVFVFVDSDVKRVVKQKGLPSRRRRARIFREACARVLSARDLGTDDADARLAARCAQVGHVFEPEEALPQCVLRLCTLKSPLNSARRATERSALGAARRFASAVGDSIDVHLISLKCLTFCFKQPH